MDWRGRPESTNVEDRRGSGSGGGKTPGIIGIIVLLVGAYYGVDLSGLVGTAGLGTGTVRQSSLTQEEEKELAKMSKVVLADTEATWRSYFSEKLGKTYTPARMVFYTGGTHTSCGAGQAAMGPFYCPGDRSVYLDLSFYDDMRKKLGASGEAAFAYVIAHEVGHHVQNLLGTLGQAHTQMRRSNKATANQISVRIELQADCYAGIWGNKLEKYSKIRINEADIRNGLKAAEAVGDDTLMQRAGQRVNPANFTHGSAADRMKWLNTGLQYGEISRCNTFN